MEEEIERFFLQYSYSTSNATAKQKTDGYSLGILPDRRYEEHTISNGANFFSHAVVTLTH